VDEPDNEGRPALAPIAVGNHFGGYLAVLDAERPLDQVDTRAIEHAATMFALEMLRERTAYELEYRLKGDLLRELFNGPDDERDALRLLADLGYTAKGVCRVAHLDVGWRGPTGDRPAPWIDEVADPRTRLYPALQLLCSQIFGDGVVMPWRSRFLLLVPAQTDDVESDLRLAQHLHTLARDAAAELRDGAQIRFALSSPLPSASHLEQGMRESDQAFAAARILDIVDRPVVFEHLGVYRVLLGGGGP